MTPQLMTVTGMIFVATFSTLIPHPPNFSPMAAIALFAGAHCANKRVAFLLPLSVLFLRDVFVGMHVLMPFVYACYAVSVCLGLCVRHSVSPLKIAGASILGSCLFFVITNFAVWLLLGTFPPNPEGLAACYVAGLPHFKNTVFGDLFYATIMFGVFALANRQFAPRRAEA